MKSSCFVYVLYSPSKDRFYVGYTRQLADRFQRHQTGRSKSTKSGSPWLIVYLERFDNASVAYQRETQIKRRKSKDYLRELADGYIANPFLLPNE
ncbi:GIY-YIG nuclease family protein [Lewinella sp. W8]|uniref:GIY-YIG nuclease family protein n=1 Tax=Lewinella sp. W8 TaxID=2528208 RepID=UPI00106737D9|nr:GIY-YIG nuclease family protein [Lewinella sp. W8]MTB51768.1 GIY-YIG nuclease family protein [Lewinella sp. W8]